MTVDEFLSGAPLPEGPLFPHRPVNPWEYVDPAVCPLPLELAVRDRWCGLWWRECGGYDGPCRGIATSDRWYLRAPSRRGRA